MLEAYLDRVLLNLRSTSASGLSPAQRLLGRPLRVPIVSRYCSGEEVIYSAPHSGLPPSLATYLIHKGHNTAWIKSKGRPILASNSQLAPPGLATTEPDNNDLEDLFKEARCELNVTRPNVEARTLRDRSKINLPSRYREGEM